MQNERPQWEKDLTEWQRDDLDRKRSQRAAPTSENEILNQLDRIEAMLAQAHSHKLKRNSSD